MIKEYKYSISEKIPESWEVVKFNEVCKTSSKKYSKLKGKCIELEHIEQETSRLLGYANIEDKSSSKSAFFIGDVLFCKLRPYLRKYWKCEFEGGCTSELMVLSPKHNLTTDYLFYTIQRDSFIENSVSKSYGTKMPRTSWKILSEFEMGLPSIDEQQRIADILSTVDAKIEIIAQQITETQELKKGLMQRLLTKGIGHTEFKDSPLGKIPKSWEVVKIGDVLKLGSGKDYKHLKEGSIPVYGTGGVMTYVNEYLYEGESVGIGRKGTIDKPVYLNGKFWTVDTLFYTHSFRNVIPFYIYVVFQSIDWRKHSEATGVPSLSRKIIEPLKILLPSIIEQTKIANILNSVDEKLNLLSERKSTYQELKQGLMQQLLTGKVRVKI